MSNKTPYEIRLELLQLANSILSDKVFGERNRLENDWNVTRDEWNIRATQGDFTVAPKFPEMPFVDDDEIVELAKKLNEFVSNG